MTTYLSVTPGIDMSRELKGKPVTKKWLREYLRSNPEKDFRIAGRTSYVNGEDCIRMDLSLEVRRPDTLDLVAAVEFQPTTEPGPSGYKYQAVVR